MIKFKLFGYQFFFSLKDEVLEEIGLKSIIVGWFVTFGCSKKTFSLYQKCYAQIESYSRLKYTYFMNLPFGIWFIKIDLNKYWFPVMFHYIREPRKK